MNNSVGLLLIIIGILGFIIYRFKEDNYLQTGGSCGSRGSTCSDFCGQEQDNMVRQGIIGANIISQEPQNQTYTYKEWDLQNCNQPFNCCDDSSVVKVQKYIPSNQSNCAKALTTPSITSPLKNAGSFSNLSGLFNLKVNANAGAFTDKAIFDNVENDIVETPCGPVSTFNAYASPMALPVTNELPRVVTNILDNAIPPHMMTQVELVRRAPYGIPEPQPLPVNALPIESPCNFSSEKTNLASFFRRNTNLFFKDEQQFPICQTSWPAKTDCLNNLMYNTSLSPKENFLVNKV
jgi:hypothetical protein